MFLQALAAHERVTQAVDDILLLGSEVVRMFRVECRPQLVLHLVILSVDSYDTALLVYKFHKAAVHHIPLGMLHGYLTRQFELNDRNSLMHLSNQTHILLVEIGTFLIHTRLVYLTRVIGILFHCKCRQRHHIDSIAVLKGCCIGIAQRETEHTGDTAGITSRSTHPQHVVVTPGYVKVVVLTQSIHDVMRSGTTVKYVTQDMQTVTYQTLDKIAERRYEVVGTPREGSCAPLNGCILTIHHGTQQ